MPIYEYHCQACGKDFEAMRGVLERDEPTACVRCHMKLLEVDATQEFEPAVTRKVSLTSQHVWRGSSDGAMPKGKSK
jgi:putative FmdB family regulatory protein